MREIRFRGKRISTGDWVYGDLIQTEKNFEKRVQILDWTQIQALIDVDRDTVGQFTGLRDKNGKEIYEGDIVLAFIGRESYGKGKISFYNGIFWIEWIDDREADMEPAGCAARPFGRAREPLEVIGNIHEHKHLLQ